MLDAADRRSQPAYESVYAQFSLEVEFEQLSGDRKNRMNASMECCDRHFGANRVALRCLAQESTYKVVNDHHGLDHVVHDGFAAFPMSAYSVAVLDDEGRDFGINEPGCLAIDVKNSSLLWFYGYLNEESPTIRDVYYRTGDTVEREPAGAISFVGRCDDVITSSGYRIGLFDVESALLEHPAVIEAAVVGVPDTERTEIVKACVVLAADVLPSDKLTHELAQHVKRRPAAHSYPRAIDFVDELPKTPSGKIQRFILSKAEIEELQQQHGMQV